MSIVAANLLTNEQGTGAPDFLGMPTVDGVPVVESGSNTDGSWTRWADGTQQCFTQVFLSGSGIRGMYWAFPIFFGTASVYAFCTASTARPDLYWASRESATESGVNIWFNADGYVDVFATGRWK